MRAAFYGIIGKSTAYFLLDANDNVLVDDLGNVLVVYL